MRKGKYYPPKHATGQFHCPHCGVYAEQIWANVEASANCHGNYNDVISNLTQFNRSLDHDWTISSCQHCGNIIIWLNDKIVYPKKMIVDLPNDDLSEDIKKDYLEAAVIFDDSVRSSAALLRLALQKSCIQLGEKGKNINDDIKNLVKKGLSPQVQKSLDILRVTGNNAIHPGEINVEVK